MLEPSVERAIRELLDVAFTERDAPLRQDRAMIQAQFSLKGRFGGGAMAAAILQRFETELKERADKALSSTLDTLARLSILLIGPLKGDVTALLEVMLRQQREKLEAILLEAPPFKQNPGSHYPVATQAPGSYLNDTLGVAMRHIEAQLALRFLEAERAAPATPPVPVLNRPAMAGPSGAFIPARGTFDVFKAISAVLKSATQDVMIVDPYMDESALTEFGEAVASGVRLRLLADQKSHKPALGPAVRRWASQYGLARPLEVRLAKPGALHDRHIFVDRSAAWALTQSLNAIAARTPAEVIRADDHAAEKIKTYEAIWSVAIPLT